MMTKYTTWTRMFGERFDQAYDSDPHNEFDISEDERDYREFMERVEKVLEPLGLHILGNGEIIGEIGLDIDLDDLKERLGEWK